MHYNAPTAPAGHNSLLNKWVTMKKEFNSGGAPDRRPFLSSECDDLSQVNLFQSKLTAGASYVSVGRPSGGASMSSTTSRRTSVRFRTPGWESTASAT